MDSDRKGSDSGLETTALDVGVYGTMAYGIGYLLVVLGIGMFTLELGTLAGGLKGVLGLVLAWIEGGPALFLFLAWFAALIFAGQIIARARKIQKEMTSLRAYSLPVTAFSMIILFLGLTGITLHVYILQKATPSGWHVGLLLPSILSVGGAIVLMTGFQVYSRELIASKVVGGSFVLTSIMLLYVICLTPWRQLWSLIGASYPVIIYFPRLPPLPGPLLCESNIETLTLLSTAVFGLLFAIPTFKEESSRPFGRVIVSAMVILFSAGLMFFNYSALSWIIAFTSQPYPPNAYWPASLWIILFGFLVLAISGIIIFISACLSITSCIKEISARPTPSAKRRDIRICPNCRSEVPLDALYCPKCGKEITNTSR